MSCKQEAALGKAKFPGCKWSLNFLVKYLTLNQNNQ